MNLKEIIYKVSNSWTDYLSKINIDKNDKAYNLVLHSFPEVLKGITPYKEKFKFQGSRGVGRIPNAPWIAILDKSITESAEDGYYLVFLFSSDLEVMYLAIAFGTTEFRQRFGGGKKLYAELRKAAKRIQDRVQDGKENIEKLFGKKLFLEAIDLRTSKNEMRQKDYEASSIYSIRYDLKNLPEENELVADYQLMLGLYETITVKLSISTVEELVDDLVELPSYKYVEAKLFSPRGIKSKKSTNKGGNVRRSDKSKKIGDAGEKFVYENEKIKLRKCGLDKEAEMVKLVSADKIGWDITSYDEKGNEIYIEVKSSVTSKISAIEVTKNEYDVLNNLDYKNKYFIYLVTNIFKECPGLEFIPNPSEKIKDGTLEVTPTVYRLGL
jgi:hypothetical protein